MCISLQMKWTDLYHMIGNVQKNRRVAQKGLRDQQLPKFCKKSFNIKPSGGKSIDKRLQSEP